MYFLNGRKPYSVLFKNLNGCDADRNKSEDDGDCEGSEDDSDTFLITMCTQATAQTAKSKTFDKAMQDNQGALAAPITPPPSSPQWCPVPSYFDMLVAGPSSHTLHPCATHPSHQHVLITTPIRCPDTPGSKLSKLSDVEEQAVQKQTNTTTLLAKHKITAMSDGENDLSRMHTSKATCQLQQKGKGKVMTIVGSGDENKESREGSKTSKTQKGHSRCNNLKH